MKTFQTQCSNCHHVFTINESQLAFKNGLARCGNCKQIFSAKDNLIEPPPLTESQKVALAQLQAQKQHQQVSPQANPHTQTPVVPTASLQSIQSTGASFDLSDDFAPATSAPTGLTKKQKRAKTGDGLISDDEIPDDLAKEVSIEKTSPSPTNSDFSLDILEDFDIQPNIKKVEIDYHQPESNTVSTDAKKTGDESWLEDMVAEEKIKERDKSFLADAKANPAGVKSDVADLLDDLGVDVVPEASLSTDDYVKKMSERLEHTSSSQQVYEKKSLLAPLLWGLACLFLLGLLLVQYVVFNVDNLMKNKDHAQTLTSLCQATHLPCKLAQANLASVDIKTLSVENNGGKTDVLFTLTNKSSQPVLYPNLKISLQKNNSSIGTIVLSPEQYLDDKTTEMAPQQIEPIKLRLDVKRDSFDQALIESFY